MDTMGEEDTESMLMLEPSEEQGLDDGGRSLVDSGPQGPQGREGGGFLTHKRLLKATVIQKRIVYLFSVFCQHVTVSQTNGFLNCILVIWCV